MRIQSERFIMILQWVIAALFIYAGVVELSSLQDFSDNIASFDILPRSVINIFAVILPPFEVILGIGIIVGIKTRPALLGLTALAFIFLIALLSLIFRGISVDCGCFGSNHGLAASTWYAIGRDLIILIICGKLYYNKFQRNDSLQF